MTTIQKYQLIAVIVLIAYVLFAYINNNQNNIIFFPIVFINLGLWIARQAERKRLKASDQSNV